MKVNVDIINEGIEEETLIKAHRMTEEIKQAISLLSDSKINLFGIKDTKSYVIDPASIYYIETVDNKTYIITKNDMFDSKLKLYELEEILDNRFLRCSKSMICNIKKIKNVKASLNGRFDATLLNDEKIVISRSYVKDLKKRLGLGVK